MPIAVCLEISPGKTIALVCVRLHAVDNLIWGIGVVYGAGGAVRAPEVQIAQHRRCKLHCAILSYARRCIQFT